MCSACSLEKGPRSAACSLAGLCYEGILLGQKCLHSLVCTDAEIHYDTGCFHFGAIGNGASRNMNVQVSR